MVLGEWIEQKRVPPLKPREEKSSKIWRGAKLLFLGIIAPPYRAHAWDRSLVLSYVILQVSLTSPPLNLSVLILNISYRFLSCGYNRWLTSWQAFECPQRSEEMRPSRYDGSWWPDVKYQYQLTKISMHVPNGTGPLPTPENPKLTTSDELCLSQAYPHPTGCGWGGGKRSIGPRSLPRAWTDRPTCRMESWQSTVGRFLVLPPSISVPLFQAQGEAGPAKWTGALKEEGLWVGRGRECIPEVVEWFACLPVRHADALAKDCHRHKFRPARGRQEGEDGHELADSSP